MAVTPSVVTDSEVLDENDTPTIPEQVWTMSRLFLPQWAQDIEITSTWETDIKLAKTLAEKRLGLTGKPKRMIRCTIEAYESREVWQLLNGIRRMGTCRSMIPIYSDATRTLEPITNPGLVPCDTTNRRFFPGARFVIGKVKQTCSGWGPEFEEFRVHKIGSLTEDSIAVHTDNAPLWDHARIYPVMECQIIQAGDLEPMSGNKCRFQLIAVEVPGTTCLPPLVDQSLDSGYEEFDTYPIFEPELYYSQHPSLGFQTEMRMTNIGLGQVINLIGDRPRLKGQAKVATFTRAQAWKLLKMWDWCSGPGRPFLTVAPFNMFEVVNLTSTNIQVKASGPFSDWETYNYLALKRRQAGDNTSVVRRITNVIRAGDVDELTLNEPHDLTVADLSRVSIAYLGRFTDESITELWSTQEHCSIQFKLNELLEEKQVVFIDPDNPDYFPPPDVEPDDPPDPVPPPPEEPDEDIPETWPARTPITIALPYSGDNVLIENLDIDAKNVTRLVTLRPNQTVIIKNCTIRNAYNVIEGNTSGSTIKFINVSCEVVDRYVCYVESKVSGVPVYALSNTVIFKYCNFKSSRYETPVRMMYGVYAEFDQCEIHDSLDVASNKAMAAVRLHCHSALIKNSHFSKWVKLGVSTTDNAKRTTNIEAYNVNFEGGVRLENLEEYYFQDCTLSGNLGASTYSLSGEGSYTPADIGTLVNCDLIGNLSTHSILSATGCTDNGDPFTHP